MRRILFLFLFFQQLVTAQPIRVAILDFDNTSGITKYDGLGKALSSMLISDIESNVSSKRLQLVERSQINKIIKEQNLQKSTAFDKSTSVKMGKLLGVSFVLVGDIFVLDNNLVITSRLVDVTSGDIKFSEKQEGKLPEWLLVKTKLGKSVATSLSIPFSEPRIPDVAISAAVLTTYASAINENDDGNFEKAETLINTAKEFDPGFKYLDDLKDEMDKLKKEVANLRGELETSVANPIEAASNFFGQKDFPQAIKYFQIGLKRIPNTEFGNKYAFFVFLSEAYFENGNYKDAIDYADSALIINPFEVQAIFNKAKALIKLNRINEGVSIFKTLINNHGMIGNMELFMRSIYNFSMKNRSHIFRGLEIDHSSGSVSFVSKIQYPSIQEFEKDYDHYYKWALQNLKSNGYYFNQIWDINQLIPLYADVMTIGNLTPLQIANQIDELNWGNENSDIFSVFYKTGVYGNTKVGVISDSSLFVIAKTGKPYTGTAHFSTIDFVPGLYSNKNSISGNFKITSNDFLMDFMRTSGINQYTANIECPCESLIDRKSYDELAKNKTDILVNDFDYATKYSTSAWYYLLSGSYKASVERFQSVINFHIKAGRSLDGHWLSKDNYDKYRMSIINLAHAFLLQDNYFKAKDLYSNKILYRDFGDNFGNLSKDDVIKNDWDDFIKHKLIRVEKLKKLNLEYKFISEY